MKSEISRILAEKGIDHSHYDLEQLYQIGKKNIIENIELYWDKDYSCKSVLRSLFVDGIVDWIKQEGKSKIEILIEEKTKKLKEDKLKIEQKNKEIVQSIEYARSLQNSILPSYDKINNYLKDYFLIWSPKDIVGGDFFFFDSTGEDVFFAVADCTGHGVPGGMISLICSSALNKCISELGLKNTDEILNMTRLLVIDTFNKNGQNVNDGMDIIMCKWTKNLETIEFSGAGRPLWVINSTDMTLREYKTDRFPVSKYFELKPFSKYTLDVKSGDILYMFSDGVTDQFGGESGGKFKTSRLKDLIDRIKFLNIKEQENIVNFSLKQWKGDFEQTDDICFWAIKF